MLELQEKLLDKMIEISHGYEYHHGVYFFCPWDGDWFHVEGVNLLPFLRENLRAYAMEEGDEEVLRLLDQEEEECVNTNIEREVTTW